MERGDVLFKPVLILVLLSTPPPAFAVEEKEVECGDDRGEVEESSEDRDLPKARPRWKRSITDRRYPVCEIYSGRLKSTSKIIQRAKMGKQYWRGASRATSAEATAHVS